MKKGEFPLPLLISENKVRWIESEVNAWIMSRPRRSYRNTMRAQPIRNYKTIARTASGEEKIGRHKGEENGKNSKAGQSKSHRCKRPE